MTNVSHHQEAMSCHLLCGYRRSFESELQLVFAGGGWSAGSRRGKVESAEEGGATKTADARWQTLLRHRRLRCPEGHRTENTSRSRVEHRPRRGTWQRERRGDPAAAF